MVMKLKNRVENALEILGYSVIFSALQILFVYFVFKITFFETYRNLYNHYFFLYNYFYQVMIYVYDKIFGNSILNNPVFYGMFLRIFFILFLLNIIYFVYRSVEKKNEVD